MDPRSPNYRQVVQSFKGITVAVFGDSMLDEYIEGEPTRLSPEAPVPVIKPSKTIYRLGGAANVAANIVSLGGTACLIGSYGPDENGRNLETTAAHEDVTLLNVAAGAVRTIRKVRIIGRQGSRMHQYVRLDDDYPQSCDATKLCHILNGLNVDCVVVADYAKGTVTPAACAVIRDYCTAKGIPWIIDPKPGSSAVSSYTGCALIKPNLVEAEQFTGTHLDPEDDDMMEAACRALSQLFQASVLITTGQYGIRLHQRGTLGHQRVMVDPVPVMDVTGAGDTVSATMALCLGLKMQLYHAAKLACEAARVCVSLPYTTPVHAAQLLAQLNVRQPKKRIFTDVEEFLQTFDTAGNLVVANGCFDILHAGHLALLNEARKHGSLLVVALNSDFSVAQLKGPQRPINTWNHRAELLAALRVVDAVILFDELSPVALFERLKPAVVVHGDDSIGTTAARREREVVEKHGGQVVYVSRTIPLSTTGLHEAAEQNA